MNIFDQSVAEIEVYYSNRIPAKDRIKICGSQDAYNASLLFWPSTDHVEYFYVLYLNRHSHILGCHQISKGGFTGTVSDVRVIFQIALKACSTSLVAIHYAKKILMLKNLINYFITSYYSGKYFA